MGRVVAFAKPEPEVQFMNGTGLCTACRHEWPARAPVGTSSLECPSCGTHRGIWAGPVIPTEGEPRFVCDCGGDLFYILRGGMQCHGCAVMASGF